MIETPDIDLIDQRLARHTMLGCLWEQSSTFPPFPEEEFDIIYANPPWCYKGQLQHVGSGNGTICGVKNHYKTATLKMLSRLRVKSITARNCMLFMWSSNPHLDQVIKLGETWGFSQSIVAFVRNKERSNSGYYAMNQCEISLAFKIGKTPTPRGSRNTYQHTVECRSIHSRKPNAIRKQIHEMFPFLRKIELFARKPAINRYNWELDCNG